MAKKVKQVKVEAFLCDGTVDPDCCGGHCECDIVGLDDCPPSDFKEVDEKDMPTLFPPDITLEGLRNRIVMLEKQDLELVFRTLERLEDKISELEDKISGKSNNEDIKCLIEELRSDMLRRNDKKALPTQGMEGSTSMEVLAKFNNSIRALETNAINQKYEIDRISRNIGDFDSLRNDLNNIYTIIKEHSEKKSIWQRIAAIFK